MNGVDQRDGVVDWRLLQDAVPEIEDMPGSAGGLIENVFSSPRDFFWSGQQGSRIQVTLHGPLMSHGSPSLVEPNAPINADNCASSLGQ